MKRLKSVLKWTAIIAVGLVALGLIMNGCFAWRANSRYEAALAEIRAAGEPLSLADLAPEPVPAEQNAFALLDAQRRALQALELELHEIRKDKEVSYSGERLTVVGAERTRRAFAEHPAALRAIDAAYAAPSYQADIDYSQSWSQLFENERISLPRQPARITQGRIDLLIFDQEYDEALEHAVRLLKFSRTIADQSALVNYLVVVAVRGMALQYAARALYAGAVSERSRQDLESELSAINISAEVNHAIVTEQVFVFDQLRRSTGTGLQAWFQWWPLNSAPELKATLDFYRRQAKQEPNVRREPHPQVSRYGFAQLMSPAFKAADNAAVRSCASVRCLRVLNALQARIDETATDSPQFERLGLPADTFRDPATGKPLIVKRREIGWLVYSVWGPVDGIEDDGGSVADRRDTGFGPP